MSYFHWIAGCPLGLAWLWRLVDARWCAEIADISRPEWDRAALSLGAMFMVHPAGQHHRSACNEAADIEATLTRLLCLTTTTMRSSP